MPIAFSSRCWYDSRLMSSLAQRARGKLHATVLIVGLLLGWASAPVALATQTSDVCDVACCVQAGHCCCVARHARVLGDGSEGRDTFRTPQASSHCPEGCGNGSASSPIFSRDLNANAAHSFALITSGAQPRELLGLKLDLTWIGFSTSRAPPAKHLN
jgi:hypothetical protein